MIDAATIREIISVYTKHGWSLRRVLLSDGLRKAVGAGIFGDASLHKSDLDAVWFSRSTKKDGMAWEIRHLSSAPFALLVVVSDAASEFNEALLETEERLRETLRARFTGH